MPASGARLRNSSGAVSAQVISNANDEANLEEDDLAADEDLGDELAMERQEATAMMTMAQQRKKIRCRPGETVLQEDATNTRGTQGQTGQTETPHSLSQMWSIGTLERRQRMRLQGGSSRLGRIPKCPVDRTYDSVAHGVFDTACARTLTGAKWLESFKGSTGVGAGKRGLPFWTW